MCDITNVYILDNLILIPTLISTPNVPICKSKYQIMFLFDLCRSPSV